MNRFVWVLCTLLTAILLVGKVAHAQETTQPQVPMTSVPSIPALNASLGEDMEVDADGYRRRLVRLHDSVAPGTRTQGEYELFIACSAACVNRDGSSDVRSTQRCISLGVPSRLASHGYSGFGTIVSCNRGIDLVVDHARLIETEFERMRPAASRVQELERRAARIEAELVSLRNSAGPMAEQNVALQLQISTLQTQLATANVELATARAQVAEFQAQQALASERTARARPRRSPRPRMATARPPRQITTRGASPVVRVQPRSRTPRTTRVAAAANTGNSSDPAQADPARLPRNWRHGLTPMHIARGNRDWHCNLSVTVVRADMQVSPCVAGVNSQLSRLAIHLASVGPVEAYNDQVTTPDEDWHLWGWYQQHLTPAQFQALMAMVPVNMLGRHLTLKARTPDNHDWSYLRIGRYWNHVLPTSLTTFRSRIPHGSGPTRIMVPDHELVWLPRGPAPASINQNGAGSVPGNTQARIDGTTGQALPVVTGTVIQPSNNPPQGGGPGAGSGRGLVDTNAGGQSQTALPPIPPDALTQAQDQQRAREVAAAEEARRHSAGDAGLARGTGGIDDHTLDLIRGRNRPIRFGKGDLKILGYVLLVLIVLFSLWKVFNRLTRVKLTEGVDGSEYEPPELSQYQKDIVERMSQAPPEPKSTASPEDASSHKSPSPDIESSGIKRRDGTNAPAADVGGPQTPAQAGTG